MTRHVGEVENRLAGRRSRLPPGLAHLLESGPTWRIKWVRGIKVLASGLQPAINLTSNNKVDDVHY